MKTEPDVIPAVEVHDLAFAYGKVPVLESANLMIESGEFVSIVGPNGGGKNNVAEVAVGRIASYTRFGTYFRQVACIDA